MRQFNSAHFVEIRQSPPTSEVCTTVPFTDACLVSKFPPINLGKRRGNLLGLRCRKPLVLRITFGLGYHAGGANRVDEREE